MLVLTVVHLQARYFGLCSAMYVKYRLQHMLIGF